MNLNLVEGYSHKEIGEMLNISEEGSRSQLHSARIAEKNIDGTLLEKRPDIFYKLKEHSSSPPPDMIDRVR